MDQTAADLSTETAQPALGAPCAQAATLIKDATSWPPPIVAAPAPRHRPRLPTGQLYPAGLLVLLSVWVLPLGAPQFSLGRNLVSRSFGNAPLC